MAASAIVPDDEIKRDFVLLFPEEIVLNIFGKLQPQYLGRCSVVSRKWKRLAETEILWQKFLPIEKRSMLKKQYGYIGWRKIVIQETLLIRNWDRMRTECESWKEKHYGFFTDSKILVCRHRSRPGTLYVYDIVNMNRLVQKISLPGFSLRYRPLLICHINANIIAVQNSSQYLLIYKRTEPNKKFNFFSCVMILNNDIVFSTKIRNGTKFQTACCEDTAMIATKEEHKKFIWIRLSDTAILGQHNYVRGTQFILSKEGLAVVNQADSVIRFFKQNGTVISVSLSDSFNPNRTPTNRYSSIIRGQLTIALNKKLSNDHQIIQWKFHQGRIFVTYKLHYNDSLRDRNDTPTTSHSNFIISILEQNKVKSVSLEDKLINGDHKYYACYEYPLIVEREPEFRLDCLLGDEEAVLFVIVVGLNMLQLSEVILPDELVNNEENNKNNDSENNESIQNKSDQNNNDCDENSKNTEQKNGNKNKEESKGKNDKSVQNKNRISYTNIDNGKSEKKNDKSDLNDEFDKVSGQNRDKFAQNNHKLVEIDEESHHDEYDISQTNSKSVEDVKEIIQTSIKISSY